MVGLPLRLAVPLLCLARHYKRLKRPQPGEVRRSLFTQRAEGHREEPSTRLQLIHPPLGCGATRQKADPCLIIECLWLEGGDAEDLIVRIHVNKAAALNERREARRHLWQARCSQSVTLL